MIRCFVAIPLPTDVLTEMSGIIGQLRELGIDARFSRPESIHLTLRFLGDVSGSVVPSILEAVKEGVCRFRPFEVGFRRAGTFPHLANPRVVWLGVEPQEELRKLQASIEHGLVGLGFRKEERPFKPHLTLARIKSRRKIAALMHFLEEQGPLIELGRFTVEEVVVFRSELRPDGAVYTRLGSASLQPRGTRDHA